MKKNEIPQDPSALENYTRDVCYVTDETGRYTTGLSRGWEIKSKALDIAWKEIDERIKSAKERVAGGNASPVLLFMELKLMDIDILASYTGFWKWRIKRHMKPGVFKKLPEHILKKYAMLFEITVEELKNPFKNAGPF